MTDQDSLRQNIGRQGDGGRSRSPRVGRAQTTIRDSIPGTLVRFEMVAVPGGRVTGIEVERALERFNDVVFFKHQTDQHSESFE